MVRWREILLPLVVSAVVLLIADPGHSLTDLRLDLLLVTAPVAERHGLPAAALPWLLYPLVALNILAPVAIWSWCRAAARLRVSLVRGGKGYGPWPTVTVSEPVADLEERMITVTPGFPRLVVVLLLLTLVPLLAAGLWGRDQWRLAVADPEGGFLARLPVAAEFFAIWLGARCTWAVAPLGALCGLRRGRFPCHGWGGWLVTRVEDGRLHAARLRLNAENWAARVARRITDALNGPSR